MLMHTPTSSVDYLSWTNCCVVIRTTRGDGGGSRWPLVPLRMENVVFFRDPRVHLLHCDSTPSPAVAAHCLSTTFLSFTPPVPYLCRALQRDCCRVRRPTLLGHKSFGPCRPMLQPLLPRPLSSPRAGGGGLCPCIPQDDASAISFRLVLEVVLSAGVGALDEGKAGPWRVREQAGDVALGPALGPAY